MPTHETRTDWSDLTIDPILPAIGGLSFTWQQYNRITNGVKICSMALVWKLLYRSVLAARPMEWVRNAVHQIVCPGGWLFP
jgi:hypothetical protein